MRLNIYGLIFLLDIINIDKVLCLPNYYQLTNIIFSY